MLHAGGHMRLYNTQQRCLCIALIALGLLGCSALIALGLSPELLHYVDVSDVIMAVMLCLITVISGCAFHTTTHQRHCSASRYRRTPAPGHQAAL